MKGCGSMTREMEALIKHLEECEKSIDGLFQSGATRREQMMRAFGAVQLMQRLYPELDDELQKLWNETWYYRLLLKVEGGD